MNAKTPGLSTALDIVLARFAADKDRPSTETSGQLSLFDVSQDGATLVSFDGQTL